MGVTGLKEPTPWESKTIGEYNFAGQYQQSPAPLGGGLVKAHRFKRYVEKQRPELPAATSTLPASAVPISAAAMPAASTPVPITTAAAMPTSAVPISAAAMPAAPTATTAMSAAMMVSE